MKKFLILLTLVVYLSLSSATLVFAEEDLDRQLREKQEEIKRVESQLSETRKQEKTLKSQLTAIDSQTALTKLRIEETNFKIAKLNKEISDLETRMTRISANIDRLSEALLNMIIKTYKYSNTNTIDLFFSSFGFADLLRKVKYVETVQAEEKKYLYDLQATKSLYNDQKDDKQKRQDEQEKYQQQLEKYQDELDEQKKAKAELLKVTQNDEAKFQSLLVRLRADTESIARALASKGTKVGSVSKGERIATVGNTGCSTGPHLHFEVMTPARVENGIIIGRENKVDPLPYIQSGQFYKPTTNYSESKITTTFGEKYFLGTHTGLDIADYPASIYAVMDGESYSTQDTKPCYLTNTIGKGVFVDHKNNIVTLYWHIP